jgi:hypothetical protein
MFHAFAGFGSDDYSIPAMGDSTIFSFFLNLPGLPHDK